MKLVEISARLRRGRRRVSIVSHCQNAGGRCCPDCTRIFGDQFVGLSQWTNRPPYAFHEVHCVCVELWQAHGYRSQSEKGPIKLTEGPDCARIVGDGNMVYAGCPRRWTRGSAMRAPQGNGGDDFLFVDGSGNYVGVRAGARDVLRGDAWPRSIPRPPRRGRATGVPSQGEDGDDVIILGGAGASWMGARGGVRERDAIT